MSPKGRCQILHLEDKPAWIREVKLALDEDYELHAAKSLREAVQLFRDVDFDLVIVDIDLLSGVGRDEEGFRLIEGLQEAGILPGNRVIVLSGFAHLEARTRRAFRDYGVWDVIPKDKFDPEELRQDVDIAIRTAPLLGELISEGRVSVEIVSALANVQSVEDIINRKLMLDEFLQEHPESSFVCLLPTLDLLRRASAVHSPDDKGAYYLTALESLQHARETLAGEVPTRIEREVQLVIERWQELLLDSSQRLLLSAQIEVSLITRRLFQAKEVTIAIELTNQGRGLASSVRVCILDAEDYSLRHWIRERRIDLLPKGVTRRSEFTIQPKAATANVRFEVTYDDQISDGRRLEFADQVEFLRREGGFVRLRNPYVAGPPIDPAQGGPFMGRLDVLNWIKENLRGYGQKNVLVLHGERRTGKTSILKQLSAGRLKALIYMAYLDCQSFADTGNHVFLYNLAEAISVGLKAQGITMTLPTELLSDPHTAATRFRDWLKEAQRQVSPEGLIVAMLDEFEALEDHVRAKRLDPSIFGFLRSLLQHQARFTCILAGTHRLEEMSEDYRSVLLSVALHREIGFMERGDAEELIRIPVYPTFTYDDSAVDKLWWLTHGHPYFIQLLCHTIILNMNQQTQSNYISITDVNQAVESVFKHSQGHLRYLWDQLAVAERAVLAAMADLVESGHDYVTQGEIADCLSQLDLSGAELTDALERLTAHHLIEMSPWRSPYLTEVAYSYTFDLLRLWVYRRHPLGTLR